ncbi:YcbK family protein [Ralstonia sp. ASV6]|uniref:YcbK family protein n=1 Tax=Ralstonia sp. ASV6 TaxID=2795124 RepID=UPI0034D378C3
MLPGSLGWLPIPPAASATDEDFWVRDRQLWVRRQDTGEAYKLVYWSGGRIVIDNYIRLCYLFRDAHVDQTMTMSLDLLDLLFGLQRWAYLINGRLIPIELTCGYRSDYTNAHTEGAVLGSEHTKATAADIKIAGIAPDVVGMMAKFFRVGGVGVYSTFTHVDGGRIRQWVGHPISQRRRLRQS